MWDRTGPPPWFLLCTVLLHCPAVTLGACQVAACPWVPPAGVLQLSGRASAARLSVSSRSLALPRRPSSCPAASLCCPGLAAFRTSFSATGLDAVLWPQRGARVACSGRSGWTVERTGGGRKPGTAEGQSPLGGPWRAWLRPATWRAPGLHGWPGGHHREGLEPYLIWRNLCKARAVGGQCEGGSGGRASVQGST